MESSHRLVHGVTAGSLHCNIRVSLCLTWASGKSPICIITLQDGLIMASDDHINPEKDGRADENDQEADAPLLPPRPKLAENKFPAVRGTQTSTWLVLLLVATLTLLFESGNAIRTAPLIAVYEEKLCVELGMQPYSSDVGNSFLKDHEV